MANFLTGFKLKGNAPRIIETKENLIINGVLHKKKNMSARLPLGEAPEGGMMNLSLDRVTSFDPTNTVQQATYYTIRNSKESMITPDINDSDISYVVTHNHVVADLNQNGFIYKLRESTGELLLKTQVPNSPLVASSSSTGGIIEVLGQGNQYIYYIAELGRQGTDVVTRCGIVRYDKTTGVAVNLHLSGLNRVTYSKISETPLYIYAYWRVSLNYTYILEIDKEGGTVKGIGDIPIFAGEVDRASRSANAENLGSSKDMKYIIEFSLNPASLDTFRWIDIEHKNRRDFSEEVHIPKYRDIRHEADFSSPNLSGVLFNKMEGNYFSWNSETSIITITLNEEANIWRAGLDTTTIGALKIEKLEDDEVTWTDVTATYPQTVTGISNKEWQKTISKLPKGTYRFMKNTVNRSDTMWYIEGTAKEFVVNTFTYGVDFENVSYEDKKYSLANDSLAAMNTTFTAVTRTMRDMFILNSNGTKYLNVVEVFLSGVGSTVADRLKSKIYTFKIDEEKKELTMVNQLQIGNSTDEIKTFITDSSNQTIIIPTVSGTSIYKFDPLIEGFKSIKDFGFVTQSCGFDTNGDIYILKGNDEVLKMGKNISEDIIISLKNSVLEEYKGENIEATIKVRSENYLEEIIKSSMTLNLVGNVKFKSNDSKELKVETVAEGDIEIPITITGPGEISIFPTVLNKMN